MNCYKIINVKNSISTNVTSTVSTNIKSTLSINSNNEKIACE